MKSRLGFKQVVCLSLALCLITETGFSAAVEPTHVEAHVAKMAVACSLQKNMTFAESGVFYMFNAHLSHLIYSYGKPSFEGDLKAIVDREWPTTRVNETSFYYFERLRNLVEQARLKNAIALTIGLENTQWVIFENHMRDITLLESTANDLTHPFEVSALRLLEEIRKWLPESNPSADSEKRLVQSEAILRISNMYSYLTRWRAINGKIIDEAAAASAKNVAMLGLGLLGATVLGSTLVVSAPIVASAGLLVESFAATPALALLYTRLAETAAGSMIGLIGAPAAQMMQDSYHVLSEANKQNLNHRSGYSCELSKQIRHWRIHAGRKFLKSALIGAGMGIGGGALTFSGVTAKAVLYSTAGGVGIAQLYAIGKMSSLAIESVTAYHEAEAREAAGDHDGAVEELQHARDLAQEAGEKGLESLIIATLTYHVGVHFKEALHAGESAIRQLYAASADTIPTAVQSGVDLSKDVEEIAKESLSDQPQVRKRPLWLKPH